jgi:hypothetical protein
VLVWSMIHAYAHTFATWGCPILHRLTFLSSPPVASTPAVFLPMRRQLTVLPCATNSSAAVMMRTQSVPQAICPASVINQGQHIPSLKDLIQDLAVSKPPQSALQGQQAVCLQVQPHIKCYLHTI